MHIVAFDLSLTHSACAITRNTKGVCVPPKAVGTGVERLVYIREWVLHSATNADLVVLEGYAYGAARGNALTGLGELGGVVRVALLDAGHCWVVVPPASLKRFACGKGNATKADMLAAAIRKLGYDGSDHNTADAMWLREMALAAYDMAPASKAQREAVAKVAWPAFSLEAA